MVCCLELNLSFDFQNLLSKLSRGEGLTTRLLLGELGRPFGKLQGPALQTGLIQSSALIGSCDNHWIVALRSRFKQLDQTLPG